MVTATTAATTGNTKSLGAAVAGRRWVALRPLRSRLDGNLARVRAYTGPANISGGTIREVETGSKLGLNAVAGAIEDGKIQAEPFVPSPLIEREGLWAMASLMITKRIVASVAENATLRDTGPLAANWGAVPLHSLAE